MKLPVGAYLVERVSALVDRPGGRDPEGRVARGSGGGRLLPQDVPVARREGVDGAVLRRLVDDSGSPPVDGRLGVERRRDDEPVELRPPLLAEVRHRPRTERRRDDGVVQLVVVSVGEPLAVVGAERRPMRAIARACDEERGEERDRHSRSHRRQP